MTFPSTTPTDRLNPQLRLIHTRTGHYTHEFVDDPSCIMSCHLRVSGGLQV